MNILDSGIVLSVFIGLHLNHRIRGTKGQLSLVSSVTEETARGTSLESIVGHFAVSIIGNNAVISILLSLVGDDLGSSVWHALANFRHSFVLVILHMDQTLLCRLHELL